MNIRIDAPSGAEPLQASAGAASQAIKDTLGAEVITQTLARMNGQAGAATDAGAQFRKDVLSGMGLGNKLDMLF